MFTARKREVDYDHFFKSLSAIMLKFQINFKPDYIVIDACYASANCISKIFPDCHILMCWFHLKQNIRRHKDLIAGDNYHNINQELNEDYEVINFI